jgi:hypothetical protein
MNNKDRDEEGTQEVKEEKGRERKRKEEKGRERKRKEEKSILASATKRAKMKTTRPALASRQTQNACHTSWRITNQNTQMHVASPRMFARMRSAELWPGHGHSA